MSLKLVAVDGMTLSITAQSGSKVTPGKTSAGVDDVSVLKKEAVKISGKRVLVDKVTGKSVIVGIVAIESVHAAWGCTPTPPGAPTWTVNGSFQMMAGATSVKCDEKKCMLEGDSAMCTCSGTCVQGSSSTDFSGSCEIKISDAGQTKVKGE